jgi:phage tail sheath gpL-like
MAPRRRREYLQLLDAAKAAVELAVDCFNRVRNPYRDESTLILLTNAWELLAKAALVQKHQSIQRGQRGETIGPETAVARLKDQRLIVANQADTIQQIISLRHAAVHHVLPPVPEEIMHHLLFYGCKFFRETCRKVVSCPC